MLKTVITCLPDISAKLVSELELNHVSVSVMGVHEGETAELWLERVLTGVRKKGIKECECIVIDQDRERLQVSAGAGIKCIGFIEPNCNDSDLFGCCTYVIEGWEGISFSYISRVFHRLEAIPLMICETKHLQIRELVQEDIPRLCEICGQDSVREFICDIGDDLQEETEKHSSYIEQAYRFYDYGYWGVYDKQSGLLIGRCGIQDNVIDGIAEVELGYLLAEEQRGRGYAKEAVKAVLAYAFQELGILRVVAVIDKKNTASLHVAESCGMLWEKDIVKTDTGKQNGRICSVYAISPVSFG